MSRFDECSVLIPAATLEDFPSDLSDYDARSLLAGWTALWHPQLLRACGKLPSWYRADSPPEPSVSRLVVVPAPAREQLPSDYESRVRDLESSLWVTAATREELINAISTASGEVWDKPAKLTGKREIGVDDFFAAGFAYLQVQIMTRRLRYTSNLDEVHLQTQAVAAANSFVEGDSERAISALHDVFDLLAQERDHYFSSSDAHLIDLTLTNPTTTSSLLDSLDDPAFDDVKEDDETMATPTNVLIDGDVANALKKLDNPRLARLRELLRSGRVGWAGGGPSADVYLDTMSLGGAAAAIEQAHRDCTEAVGSPPPVFARFTGGAPSDLVGSLVKLGYTGLIPLDFARGTGFGSEAKVTISSVRGDLDALTCKPIDASSDAAFLTIGTRLGEQIDSGEIATALLAHWPGRTCESFRDLRRAASWGLCLGRFWKLDDYFRKGERPYHQGTLTATNSNTSLLLDSLADDGMADPISSLAKAAHRDASETQQAVLTQFARLINSEDSTGGGDPTEEGEQSGSAMENFVSVLLGQDAIGQTTTPNAVLVANPSAAPSRRTVLVDGGASDGPAHIFAVEPCGKQTAVTVDVPAYGFVLVRPLVGSQSGASTGSQQKQSLWKRMRPKFLLSPTLGSEKDRSGTVRLFNEFMEVTINEKTGALSGVYSGTVRGNRFSMRLVHCDAQLIGKEESDDAAVTMKCDSIETESNALAAKCVVRGKTIADQGNGVLAEFWLCYELSRGSRVLTVSGEVSPKSTPRGRPWEHYFAARAAFADSSAMIRPIVRNKLHRVKSRRVVSALGVLVDEAERQTLVTADGRPFHQRVGERFLDTLLLTAGETDGKFTLHYAFDVSSPVAASQALLSPPLQLPVHVSQQAPEIGWFLHTAPKTVQIESLRVEKRDDGTLTAIVRVVQTRPQSCSASIRFMHDVQSAVLLDGDTDEQTVLAAGANSQSTIADVNPEPTADQNETGDDSVDASPRQLKVDGDKVTVPLGSHGIADLIVFFR